MCVRMCIIYVCVYVCMYCVCGCNVYQCGFNVYVVVCVCESMCVGVHMHVCNDSEFILNRLELLVKGDNSDPNLQMLLKLIDLLASCSEGENLFIESVCQNIMSINELLKVTLCLVRTQTYDMLTCVDIGNQ